MNAHNQNGQGFAPTLTISPAKNGWVLNINIDPFSATVRHDHLYVFNNVDDLCKVLPSILEPAGRPSTATVQYGSKTCPTPLTTDLYSISPPSSASVETKTSAATGELPSVEPNRH